MVSQLFSEPAAYHPNLKPRHCYFALAQRTVLRQFIAVFVAFSHGCKGSNIDREMRSTHAKAQLETCVLRVNCNLLNSPRSACVDSHALIIITEWKEFAGYDYSRIYSTMTHPSHIWDGRNLLPLQTMSDIGFVMHSIGRRA